MCKYAMVRINLEAYSTECAGDSDVIYDGYHSLTQRILVKTQFAIYNSNANTISNYTDA